MHTDPNSNLLFLKGIGGREIPIGMEELNRFNMWDAM